MSTAIHVFKLRQIWARIQPALYSRTSDHSLVDEIFDGQIAQLRADLDVWLATKPHSRPISKNDLSIFAKAEWYQMNYDYTILLLYRSQLTVYQGKNQQLFEDCLRASGNICRGYRQMYIGTHVRYTWGTLHCLFLAGLTYLHCLWTSPAARDLVLLGDVSKTCTDCTMVLVAIAEGWKHAASYRDTFDVLASRTMTMLIESKCPTPQAPSSIDGQANFDRWMNDLTQVGGWDEIDETLAGMLNDFTEPS